MYKIKLCQYDEKYEKRYNQKNICESNSISYILELYNNCVCSYNKSDLYFNNDILEVPLSYDSNKFIWNIKTSLLLLY